MPTADQAAAADPTLFDTDPLQPGEIHLHLWMLYTSQASNDEVQSLHDKVSKCLDKYLQDAEQYHALEVNYFDDTTRPTNISSMSEATEQVNESFEYNLPPAKQEYGQCRISCIHTRVSKDRHR